MIEIVFYCAFNKISQKYTIINRYTNNITLILSYKLAKYPSCGWMVMKYW